MLLTPTITENLLSLNRKTKKMKKIIKNKSENPEASSRGFTTLVAVLIVGAIASSVAISLILLGIGTTKNSLAIQQSFQAKALADACGEYALQQIRNSTPYTGSGNLTLGQGTCNFTVTSQGGQNRTITAYGTVGTIVRKVKIIINKINPRIIVVSWQEVADF